MAYTAYDWQQTLAEKADYAEGRLRRGSPVVALSVPEGVLLLSVRRGQAKLFEIYDRLALGALGTPSDLELVRQWSVDFSHAEGFQRSPEDVTIQRVVGFAISPAFKRAFSDPLRMPLVLKAAFAQVGDRIEDDHLFTLDYDGEFARRDRYAVVAGSREAESRMDELLHGAQPDDLNEALSLALGAWAAGQWQPPAPEDDARADKDASVLPSEQERADALKRVLAEGGRVEAALIERDTSRERRYRPLRADELAPHLPGA